MATPAIPCAPGCWRRRPEPAVLQAGARSRDQFLRHRQRLFRGRERGDHRTRAEGISRGATRSWSPPRCTGRCATTPTARGFRARPSSPRSTTACSRLGMDYVDLYQIHRFDPETPIEETLEALNDVVKAGKARYIGASSMWAWQFMQALALQKANGWARFVSMQNHHEPDLSRGRARNAAAVPRPGRRRHPLVAAGARAADARRRRQKPRAAKATASAAISTRRARIPTAPSSSASAKSRRRAACRARKWRWRGCCKSRASPPRSSAPPSQSI